MCVISIKCFVFYFCFVHCSKYERFSFLKAYIRSRMAYSRFEVLTAVLLKIQIFCDIMLCDWVSGSWWSEGLEYLHLWKSAWPLKMKTVSVATHPATNYGVWKDLNRHTKILLWIFCCCIGPTWYFVFVPSQDACDHLELGDYWKGFSLQLRYLNL